MTQQSTIPTPRPIRCGECRGVVEVGELCRCGCTELKPPVLVYRSTLNELQWVLRPGGLDRRDLCANCQERRAISVLNNWALCRQCSKS
jgi:hypothetical protein